MDMMRWCLIAALGVSLSVAGCNGTKVSRQENLGQGIVRGTLGAQLAGDGRLPIPPHIVALTGQVTVVEGGAYVIREASGIEQRVAHDENTRIDRPAHVGDQIEVYLDHKGRAVLIQNIDQRERVR
jgi:hypothetical protein